MTMTFDERKEIRTNDEDAFTIAMALKEGAVRFVWTDGYTAHGVYMVPSSLFKVRYGKFSGG